VVGDDAQSIYGFRGATIQNILDFEKDFKPFGIKVFKLEQNYRSTEHIVQAANEVINFNTRQIQKKIWSDKGQGEKIKLVKALADTEEGKRVVDHLLEQKNRFHFKNADFAILYRTNAQSRIFEEYLRRYNIPYKVFGGQSFYQRKEIKDLLAYLRLAVNPNDDEALRRVINFPKRNIGNTTFNKIAETATSLNIPFFQAINQSGLAARAANTLLQFAALIEDFHAKTTTLNAYELGYFIAQRSGIIEEYKKDKTPEGEGRLENLNALLDGIKIFVEDDLVEENEEGILTDKSLASYLQNIALITDFDQEEGEFDRVTLMSVHSAKGLEFKSVFVVGLEEKLFPSFMSLEKMEDIDEERRLFYVAITRAEQLLTLSWAASRYKFGQMRYNEPSRFLEEIPEIHFENKPKSNTLFNEGSAPSSGSSVKGYFKKESNAIPQNLGIDPNNFKPSPASSIQPGMDILHLKFGKGTVLSIDGGAANRVATIRFEHLDQPEKRIMLKFAKLQIVEE
jgi:DNA helicase-2/ATP-dependent DNA helicase PcrA